MSHSTASSPPLNPAQQDAVNALHGPCLVLAGAGSGKTRVITHKIARLLQSGLAPESMFAITFTNKAAAEMRERARSLIGKPAAGVWIGTFHALGVRILREHGAALGLKPGFSILDTDDVVGILKDAGGSSDLAQVRQWAWTISRWKGAGLDADAAAAQAADADELTCARIMARYHERLLAYQSVDFDDLITLPLRLLQEDEQSRQVWQARAGYFLVDEVQDTNATQYALLRVLLGGKPGAQVGLTAVGDDDQSIYGWRGATLDNLRRLGEDYPTLRVIKLEQNYRSTNAILRAANLVIAPNPRLHVKQLWSARGEGEPVRVLESDHEEHEAERVVTRIQQLRAGSVGEGSEPRLGWRSFAVLYRANHQSRPLEQALRKAQIPYKVSGGISFFDRGEIKDLCAWLRLWVNNDDDPAFLRAATVPRRGIGHQTLAQLGEFAGRMRVSLFEALYAPSLAAALSGKALASLREFGRCVHDWSHQARHTRGQSACRALLLDWLRDIGYEQHLADHAEREAEATSRWSNVLDFCDWMAQRCATANDSDDAPSTVVASAHGRSVLEVAQTVALASTLDERRQDADVVTLSTLHAAKGLEWPHVALVGVVEGLLPFARDDDAEGAADAQSTRLEEERRLMYVGVTRAQDSLAISWTRRRKRGRSMVTAEPSRFLADLQGATTSAAMPAAQARERLRALRAEMALNNARVTPDT